MEKLHPKLLQAHGWKPKGKKWLRNHRKMAKKHAKKTWLYKEMEEFQKPGCPENGRMEILAKTKKGRVRISGKCPHYRRFFVKEVTPNLCAALCPPSSFSCDLVS